MSESSPNGLSLKSAEEEEEEEEESSAESCRKALGLDYDYDYDLIDLKGRVIRKTDVNVTSKYAVITLDATRRIARVNLRLSNPQGQYCIAMTAKNVIRNVKITAACGARIKAVSAAANRTVGIVVDECSK